FPGFTDDYEHQAAQKLREVNAQLRADNTPIESNRERRVKFRDPIDAVVHFTLDEYESDTEDADDLSSSELQSEVADEVPTAARAESRQVDGFLTTASLPTAAGNDSSGLTNSRGRDDLPETDVDSGLSSAYWRRGSGSSEATDDDKNTSYSFESDSDSVSEDISELSDDRVSSANHTNGLEDTSSDESPERTRANLESPPSPPSKDTELQTGTFLNSKRPTPNSPVSKPTQRVFKSPYDSAQTRKPNGLFAKQGVPGARSRSQNRSLGQPIASADVTESTRANSKLQLSARPKTASGSIARPRTSSALSARSNPSPPSSARQITKQKLPEYRGNPRSAYGLPREMKAELLSRRRQQRLLQEEKELEERRERELRKQEAEQAFRAWVNRKQSQQRGSQSTDSSSKEDDVVTRTVAQTGSQGAFEAWLERKRQQRRDEELRRRLRDLELSATARPKASREEAQAAYVRWLRRKREEEKQRRLSSRGPHADRRHVALSARSLRALELYLQSDEFCRYPELVL
ncbi:unnamed protein product, partial [Ixodes hexagonus]